MRQQQFDILKGIGMILVLIGHVDCPRLVFNDIYLFHMPLFFFASGCFFKPKEQSFKEYIVKRAQRLLVPYLFFLFVFFIFNLFEAFVWHDENGMHTAIKLKIIQFGIGIIGMEESLSFRTIWFLICLFEVSVIYWILAQIKDLRLRSALSVVLFIAGYLFQRSDIDIPYFIDTALTVQLFYHLGYLFITKNISNIKFSPWVSVATIIIIYIFFNQRPVFTDYRTNMFLLVSVPLTILIVWNLYNLCNHLVSSKWATSVVVSLLNRIGVESLVILGLHRNFYIVLKPLLSHLPIGEYIMSTILVVAALTGTLLLSRPLERFIPKLIGKA